MRRETAQVGVDGMRREEEARSLRTQLKRAREEAQEEALAQVMHVQILRVHRRSVSSSCMYALNPTFVALAEAWRLFPSPPIFPPPPPSLFTLCVPTLCLLCPVESSSPRSRA
jgi:hypothetical protein